VIPKFSAECDTNFNLIKETPSKNEETIETSNF